MALVESPLSREAGSLYGLAVGSFEIGDSVFQPSSPLALASMGAVLAEAEKRVEKLAAGLKASGFDPEFLENYFVAFLKGREKKEFLANPTKPPVAPHQCEVLKIPCQGETSWLNVIKRALSEAAGSGGVAFPWAEILRKARLEVTKDGPNKDSLSLLVEGKRVELKAGRNGENLSLAEAAVLGFIPRKLLREVGRGRLDLVLKGPESDDSSYLQTKGNGDGLIISHSPLTVPMEEILRVRRARIIFFDWNKV